VDPDSKRFSVSVTDGSGRRVRDGGLGRWLESIAPARTRGEVAVALATDVRVRTLNRQYRRKDQKTDVLAFAVDEPRTTDYGPRTTNHGTRQLGDIIIATGVARRQAREAGHSEQTELRVLALHGLLHLLGYDHHDRADRGRMARVEARLRSRGGLPAGLIERAGKRAARRADPGGRPVRPTNPGGRRPTNR
jgi:probable rRNA maturation factor